MQVGVGDAGSISSFVSPSAKCEYLHEDFVNDAPDIGWVNTRSAISLSFSSAGDTTTGCVLGMPFCRGDEFWGNWVVWDVGTLTGGCLWCRDTSSGGRSGDRGCVLRVAKRRLPMPGFLVAVQAAAAVFVVVMEVLLDQLEAVIAADYVVRVVSVDG